MTPPGVSCVDACGSEPATAIDVLLSRASSAAIVDAMSHLYPDVTGHAVNMGKPCGHAPRGEGPRAWMASLNPFRVHAWDAIYLYLPQASAWDCYDGESYLRIGSTFRSPCLCRPPREPRLVPAAIGGVLLGMIFPLILLFLGIIWDIFEAAPSSAATKWKEHSWRFRVALGALLHVIDHATDLLIIYHFWVVELYGYMGIATAILFGYALASSIIASATSRLRPIAGDVVKLKAEKYNGDLADVLAVTIDTMPSFEEESAASPSMLAHHRSPSPPLSPPPLPLPLLPPPPPSPPPGAPGDGKPPSLWQSGSSASRQQGQRVGRVSFADGTMYGAVRRLPAQSAHRAPPVTVALNEKQDKSLLVLARFKASSLRLKVWRERQLRWVAKSSTVKLLVRRQLGSDDRANAAHGLHDGRHYTAPRCEELRLTLDDVDFYTPPSRRMAPCGEGSCAAQICGTSISFVLGLFGAAAPFEALRILIWDVGSSSCSSCRGTDQETAAFGVLRLVQAQTESAPMLYLVAMVFTFEGLRKVAVARRALLAFTTLPRTQLKIIRLLSTFPWLSQVAVEQPLLLFTAALSLANCAFALAHFVLSPATEPTHRARDELRVHIYEGEDEYAIQQRLRGSARDGNRRPPRRSFPMVLHLGVLAFFVSDLTLRVVGLCVFTYACGTYVKFVPLGFLILWLLVRVVALCCNPCDTGSNGYRDVLSVIEGMVRHYKHLAHLASRMCTRLTLLSLDACMRCA